MKSLIFAVLAFSLAGCYTPTYQAQPQQPQQPPAVYVCGAGYREQVVIKETRSRSLIGHLVVGTTLILADCVSLLFPIDDRVEILRAWFYEGGF